MSDTDIPRRGAGRPANPEGPHPRLALTLYPTVMNAVEDIASFLGVKPALLVKAIVHRWYLDGACPLDPAMAKRSAFLEAIAQQEQETRDATV